MKKQPEFGVEIPRRHVKGNQETYSTSSDADTFLASAGVTFAVFLLFGADFIVAAIAAGVGAFFLSSLIFMGPEVCGSIQGRRKGSFPISKRAENAYYVFKLKRESAIKLYRKLENPSLELKGAVGDLIRVETAVLSEMSKSKFDAKKEEKLFLEQLLKEPLRRADDLVSLIEVEVQHAQEERERRALEAASGSFELESALGRMDASLGEAKLRSDSETKARRELEGY